LRAVRNGEACIEISDCLDKGCNDKVCYTPTCTNKILDEDETDVDCGGSVCPKCTVGRRCSATTDCSSAECESGNCACPADMVIVPQAELLGGAYCIDVTEVTKGNYNSLFLTNSPALGGQVAGCETNTSYTPNGDWPPADTTAAKGYPVRYVDWCDAYAYCKHQGRELCGNIGGGAMPNGLAASDLNRASSGGAEAGSIALDAWYNACSIQGVNTYPYNKSTYVAGLCNDGTPSTYTGGVAGPWDDYDPNTSLDHTGCNGGAVGLFQMSGNVAEWENACSGTTGASDTCAIRGGAWDSPAADWQCQWQADETRQRMPANDADTADVGFRCCQY
jgi:hypothetical protein